METEDRLESDLVKEVICDHPVGFDFFRLMSLLEVREGQPLGTTSSPKYERFRLAQEISLNFPPSSIASADYDEDHDRINVIIRCLGMLGANGVLPTVLTEYIERRVRSKRDKTLYAFINLLQHRLFTLFYRAWALNQPCIDYAWGDASRQRNRIAALAGVHDLHEEHVRHHHQELAHDPYEDRTHDLQEELAHVRKEEAAIQHVRALDLHKHAHHHPHEHAHDLHEDRAHDL